MVPETDKYLIEAIKDGDYHSFEVVFRSYYAVLCRYAEGLVHESSVAEDIASDLLMKVWESPDKIEIHTSLKAYLVRSVHNACINYLTRTKKRFQELDADIIRRLHDLIPGTIGDNPSDRLIGHELREKIEKEIESLPDECRKVFLLSRSDGLSHKEIAVRLEISENTVKVQIYRALTKIREALKGYL